MEPFTDFYEAWRFLSDHQIFRHQGINRFMESFWLDIVRVNPAVEEIDGDPAKNTATRVWLECGPWIPPERLGDLEREYNPHGTSSHDPDIDCGAPTFEEAIIKLANLVLKKYGQSPGSAS